ncbi:MAG: hypothetical protein CMD49_03815 [Gammaproteobacteria bacterium]|nr:hypothetical protein [Gammaproteobacteria bacterium]
MKFKIDKLLAIVGIIAILITFQTIYLMIQIANPIQVKLAPNYDAIIILSGNPARAEFGSKLFIDGKSKKVLLSKEKKLVRNYLESDTKQMTYEIYFQILIKNKVPKDLINLFGNDNRSTFDEALSLSATPYDNLNNLLVVTDKYHVYRANLIFKKLLPEKSIDFIFPVAAANNNKWWKNKYSIQSISSETFKTMFFYTFGNFDNYLLFID